MAMIGSNPRIVRATAAAVIEEMSSGTTVREVRSSIRISSTKTTPVIGALKDGCKGRPGSAAEQQGGVFVVQVGQAADVRTDGCARQDDRGSGPTEPPNPIVVAPPTTEVQQLWEAMYEFLRDMAYNNACNAFRNVVFETYLTKSEAE